MYFSAFSLPLLPKHFKNYYYAKQLHSFARTLQLNDLQPCGKKRIETASGVAWIVAQFRHQR